MMKIIKLIMIVAVTFMSNYSFAQTNDSTQVTAASEVPVSTTPKSQYQKVRLGIYGNIGSSWLTPKSKEYESLGSSFAYKYGLVVDVNFTQNYTFSTGININYMSGEMKYKDSLLIEGVGHPGEVSQKYKVTYIELPLLLKLKTNQMGYFTPFVQLGLRNNFRLNAYSDYEFAYGTSNDLSEDNDITDDVSFYRLSFSFSLGTEYAISKSFSAFVFVTYDNGMTNSITGSNYNWSTQKVNNQSAMFKKLGLTLGFMF